MRLHLSNHRRRLAVGLVTLLAGCAVGPHYTEPHLTSATIYHGQAALTVIDGQRQAPPLDTWWNGFHDPTLVAIVRRVLRQNLDLAAAEARVAQARAVAREAGAQDLPRLDLDGSAARQHQSLDSPLGKIASALPGYERDQTLTNLDVGASWELDLAGGLRRTAQAQRAEAQAASAMHDGVRVSVSAEAADAYFQARGLQSRIALVQAEVATDARLLALARQRVDDGVATRRVLAHARAQLARTRASLPPLQSALQRQFNRLDVLMGEPPGTIAPKLVKAPAHYAIPAIDTGDGPRQLLRRRPDVIAAERRLAASNARIGAALSEYYPKVSLAGLLGFESLGGGTLLTAAAFQPSALVGLHWRLFDFGRIDAEVARARGANAEALARYQQAMLRATEDVEDAIAACVQLQAQTTALRQQVAARTQAKAAAQEQYRAGNVSLIAVLNETRRVLVARDALARAHADQARAAVAAFRALGGGWTPQREESKAVRSAGIGAGA